MIAVQRSNSRSRQDELASPDTNSFCSRQEIFLILIFFLKLMCQ